MNKINLQKNFSLLKTILINKKAISLNLIFIFIFFYIYSYATQIIFVQGNELFGIFNLENWSTGFSVLILDDWYVKLFEVRAFPNYEPIGAITLGPLFITLPIPTILFGLLITTLVSVNLSISVYTWTNPKCRINPVTGIVSSLPAFFSGIACCAPVFLITLGASSLTTIILEVFPMLLPLALLLLVISILWSLNKIDANFDFSEVTIVTS